MPELQTMEQPKTAGFVNPNHNNRNRTRIEEEEKELEELQAKSQGSVGEESIKEEQTDTEDEEQTLSREEKSFKKRYGDLRRHLSDKETEWKDKFESLEKRLDKENIVPPKSDEDIEEWSKQYPDVAGIVETIAAKKAQEMFSKAESRLQKLDEEKEEVTRGKAEDSIRKAHPDFNKLREADSFHDWVDEQPKWVQNALYENADDADSVIRVIDLYKVDNGLTKSDYAAKRKAAAQGVKKGSKTQVDAEDITGSIKESDVAKMSMLEFEEQQDAITKAMRSNKFIYDLTGNAR